MTKTQKNYTNIASADDMVEPENTYPPTYPGSLTPSNEVDGGSYGVITDGSDYDPEPPNTVTRRPRDGKSWSTIAIISLALYAAFGSLAFLIIALMRPHYNITPASLRTAALISAVVAKTIEIAFVTVFVAFLGQAMSRRGTAFGGSTGFNMAEFSMKMWVIQPGTLLTKVFHFRTGGKTFLGILALFASVIALLYTTASDTLVSPKLQWIRYRGSISGFVQNQFGDISVVSTRCPTIITPEEDPALENSQIAASSTVCVTLQLSGNGNIDLVNFSQNWNETKASFAGNSTGRPPARTIVNGVSYVGTWLEVKGKDGVNNVTLIMPHAGLADAMRNSSLGNIAQPPEVGVGDYSVTAAIPNPALNVLCVPINVQQVQWFFAQHNIYNSSRNGTLDPNLADIFNFDTNATSLSLDLYSSEASVFEAPRFLLGVSGHGPIPFNVEVWSNNIYWDPSMYLLARTNHTRPKYTLCSIKVGLNADCAARYQSSGPDKGFASVDCSTGNAWAFKRSKTYQDPPGPFNVTNNPSLNLKVLSSTIASALGLNTGVTNGNSSLARFLTQLALDSPSSQLNPRRPSLAEALAVLFSNILTSSCVGATFQSVYSYNNTFPPNAIEKFDAEVEQAVYMSGAMTGWEALFYVVLASTFIIDLACLAYFAFVRGFVTDWTESEELLALLLDPSTSKTLDCGKDGGPATVELLPQVDETQGRTASQLREPETKLVIVQGQSLRMRRRMLSM